MFSRNLSVSDFVRRFFVSCVQISEAHVMRTLMKFLTLLSPKIILYCQNVGNKKKTSEYRIQMPLRLQPQADPAFLYTYPNSPGSHNDRAGI